MRLFVGRHGRTDYEGNLSIEGQDDARQIAGTLRGLQVGRSAVLLSSVAPRALQTAGIIKVELTIPTLVRSQVVTRVGNHPQRVQDVKEFAGNVLGALGVEHEDADVVMIAHLPLVRAVAGGQQQDGGIYEVLDGWKNPAYIPGFERLLTHPE